MADRIGRKDGVPSSNALWILASPYRTPGLELLAEHMGNSNLTEKCLKNVMQSAISDHLLQCNCTINFDDFDILAAESNKFKLLLRKSLLIKHAKPILNSTIKSFPLELLD